MNETLFFDNLQAREKKYFSENFSRFLQNGRFFKSGTPVNYHYYVISLIIVNQSRQEPSHHRLGKGGQTSPPPISEYFSDIFLQAI